jgi:hypothetical protein
MKLKHINNIQHYYYMSLTLNTLKKHFCLFEYINTTDDLTECKFDEITKPILQDILNLNINNENLTQILHIVDYYQYNKIDEIIKDIQFKILNQDITFKKGTCSNILYENICVSDCLKNNICKCITKDDIFKHKWNTSVFKHPICYDFMRKKFKWSITYDNFHSQLRCSADTALYIDKYIHIFNSVTILYDAINNYNDMKIVRHIAAHYKPMELRNHWCNRINDYKLFKDNYDELVKICDTYKVNYSSGDAICQYIRKLISTKTNNLEQIEELFKKNKDHTNEVSRTIVLFIKKILKLKADTYISKIVKGEYNKIMEKCVLCVPYIRLFLQHKNLMVGFTNQMLTGMLDRSVLMGILEGVIYTLGTGRIKFRGKMLINANTPEIEQYLLHNMHLYELKF